jgi:hypothetical protein
MKTQTSTILSRDRAAEQARPRLPVDHPSVSLAHPPAPVGRGSPEASHVKMLVWRSNAAWLLIIGVISQLLPSAISGYSVEPAWFWFLFTMLGFDFVARGALNTLTGVKDNRLSKQINAA